LILVAFLTYFPLLFSFNLVNPDAQYIFPLLDNLNGIGDYFQALFTFQTLDFQPIRDLTFFIDLKFFQLFQFNTSIWQNLFWWVCACVVINRILKIIFPLLNNWFVFVITLAFMVYPLFSQTIGWGVARKHLLAFFFTVLLTEIWLRKRSMFSGKEAILISTLFACSVLSQPISVLWPCWALAHLLLLQRQLFKSSLKIFVPLGLIMISVVLINYFYYETSPVFLSNFKTITKNKFSFADCILAIGHYVFQVFVPYLLSYRYTLGHWATMAGLGILGCFAFFIRGMKVKWKWAVSWIIFSFMPILMVLTNPKAQYDTYLLIPSLGILILFLSAVEKQPKFLGKFGFSLSLIFVLFWSVFTNIEVRAWTSELQMVKRSFERRPSCLSAADYLRLNYENDKLGSEDAKNYLFNYECESFSYSGKGMMILQAYMLFYESSPPLEQRLERLKRLSSFEFFPHMILASLYVKEKMFKEADLEIDAIENKWKSVRFKTEYSHIIAHYLAPYCKENLKTVCIQITEGFTKKAPSAYYK
jgi:hypothetical protein